MLTDLITKISAETSTAKVTIADTIRAKRPADPGLWFIVTSKKIAENDHIWSPRYYNTHKQLSVLADYAENADRSLDTILRAFTAVVDTGKATQFRDMLFNREARAIIGSLL